MTRRAGIAAIAAGTLFFAGQAGQLAFGNALEPLWVTLGIAGIAALVVAVWSLGALMTTRLGRIGWRISVAGVVLLGLFSVQLALTLAITGDIPENFVLFGLGFLLLFFGQLLLATGLRHSLGRAWLLPLVGAAGVIVAIAVEADPIHDLGLFVFEGAWIALGSALLRMQRGTRFESQPLPGQPALR